MERLIEGKIAAIINPSNIVVNRGSKDGVTVEMTFSVRLNLPDIIDPDNPENVLKAIFFEKGQLKVSKVFDNMSFCTLIGRTVYEYGSMKTLHGIDRHTVYPDLDRSLLIDPSEWKIKVGDQVIHIPPTAKTEPAKPASGT